MYFCGRSLEVSSHSVEAERECQAVSKESCEGTVRKGQSGKSYRQDILEIQVINFKELFHRILKRQMGRNRSSQ
jgi:hypothetical protein